MPGRTWVKLICGASNGDLPLIRNLCYVYASCGVDCIDVSADSAVVLTAQEAIDACLRDGRRDYAIEKPLLMISVNDNEDPHFRKAKFDPKICPDNCPRPCEKVCPAAAIPPLNRLSQSSSSLLEENGVFSERCYGCGRCVPVCPLGLIETESYLSDRNVIRDLFEPSDMRSGSTNIQRIAVDAIEIHTRQGNQKDFEKLWKDIGSTVLRTAQVVAVSFPDMGSKTVPYLNTLMSVMRHTDEHAYKQFQSRPGSAHIWQTDGRPMSGDIGKGTAHTSCSFASRLLQDLRIDMSVSRSGDEGGDRIDLNSGMHFLQLAGGTNAHSVVSARAHKLHTQEGFGGYAFGGYARKLLKEHLLALEEAHPGAHVESPEHVTVLEKCTHLAKELVDSVKKEPGLSRP